MEIAMTFIFWQRHGQHRYIAGFAPLYTLAFLSTYHLLHTKISSLFQQAECEKQHEKSCRGILVVFTVIQQLQLQRTHHVTQLLSSHFLQALHVHQCTGNRHTGSSVVFQRIASTGAREHYKFIEP